MENQTPQTIEAATPDQLAKWEQVTRDCLRRNNIGKDGFQVLLGYANLAAEMDKLVQKVRPKVKGQTPAAAVSLPVLPERDPRFTLNLPVYASKDDMIKAVESQGHEITEWSKTVIANKGYLLLTEPGVYSFWEYRVDELTGKSQVKTPQLYEAIHYHNFIDAPHQSACDIRIAYTDQPLNEWRPVMSKPVAVGDGGLSVLHVERYSDGSYVFWGYAHPDDVWRGDNRLLLCRKLQ